jgi:polar amino acid transport system substrate-binding protein
MRIRAALLLLLLPAAVHAETKPMAPDPTVLHDLAPTGTLRAAINLGNRRPDRTGPRGSRSTSRGRWRPGSACRWRS